MYFLAIKKYKMEMTESGRMILCAVIIHPPAKCELVMRFIMKADIRNNCIRSFQIPSSNPPTL